MKSRCFAFGLSLVLAVVVTASLACAQTSKLDELAKLDDLARKSYERGDYQETAKLLRQALEIFKTVFPGNHLDYANRLGYLAKLYFSMGDYAQAEPFFSKNLEILKAVFGDKHPLYADSLDHLALLYLSMGDYDQAEPLYLQALEIIKATFGDNHPHYATILIHLGKLYATMRAYAQAEPLYLKALEIRKAVFGDNDLLYADSLDHLALLYLSMGNYAQAEPLYVQAMKIIKATFGENHPHYATSLNRLAKLYTDKKAYTQAEPLYLKVIEIAEAAFGDNHPLYADNLDNLAFLYISMGSYDQAEPLFLKALEIRKAVFGDNDFIYADSLNHLALLYVSMGKHAQAESLYLKALEIQKTLFGGYNPAYVASLSRLALMYSSKGEYDKAEPLYLKALEIRRDVFGNDHPEYVIGLDDLAGLYAVMGDHAQAEPLYLKALEIIKAIFGDNHPHYATSLTSLVHLYTLKGDLAQAVTFSRRAVEIFGTTVNYDQIDYAYSLFQLASLYLSIGDYAQAESLYLKNLEIHEAVFGVNHPSYASTLVALANLYFSNGDYLQAETLFLKALEIREAVLGDNHPDYADSLHQLAVLQALTRNDTNKAEWLHLKALQIRKAIFGDNHPLYAGSLNHLALLYLLMGDYDRAESLYLKALEIIKAVFGTGHLDYTNTLHDLAAAFFLRGDHVQAESLLRQNLATAHDTLEQTALVQSERQQLAMGEQFRIRLDVYLSLALKKGDMTQAAIEQILHWKGATLVRQRQYRQAAREPAIAPLFKDLQRVTRNLASLARTSPKRPDQITAWKERMNALQAEQEHLEVQLSRQSDAFAQAKRQVTLAEITDALPDNAVLVDFLEFTKSTPQPGDKPVSQRSLLASVLRADGTASLIDLGPQQPVAQAVEIWRQSHGLSKEGVAAGQRLRQRLWEPLLPALGNTRTVFISPDGVLGRLPWAALPGPEPGTYLLETWQIALIPVPQLLPTLAANNGRRKGATGLLLVGDLDYDAAPATADSKPTESFSVAMVRGDSTFGPLPGTSAEIDGVKALFQSAATTPNIEILRQASATEARFRRLAPQFDYLHLATHGFFAPPDKRSALSGTDAGARAAVLQRDVSTEHAAMAAVGFNPGLLSGLAFTGANQPPQPQRDDGILTATEIAFLPLEGASLVTLSACETGLGATAGGEGLLGVQRAFQVSGARSTVASLWKVDDLVTRLLMERFYVNLWDKKLPRLHALREAQLWLLQHPEVLRGGEEAPSTCRGAHRVDGKPVCAPPFFWAAFQLSGDWR